MKKSLIPFLLAVVALCSCSFELPTFQDPSHESQYDISQESSSIVSESKEESSEMVQKETITAPLFNDAVGVSFANNYAARAAVIEAFGEILAGMDLKNVYQDNGGIKIGSSNLGGIWTLRFNHKIESIKYMARGYTKYDDYNKIWRNDSPSYKINDKPYSLEDSTKGTEEAKFIELEADINSDTIKFETISGRLVINSITLTYIV